MKACPPFRILCTAQNGGQLATEVNNHHDKINKNQLLSTASPLFFFLEKEEHADLTAMDEIIKANEIHG